MIVSDRLTGNMALVVHNEKPAEQADFISFAHWRVRGSRQQSYRREAPDRLLLHNIR
jgi:hypothetical protein